VKRRVLIFLALFALGIAAWLAVSHYQTPRFKGKAISTWIKLASDGNVEGIATLKEFGTNAAPEFIRQLRKQDSAWSKGGWKARMKLNPQFRQPVLNKFGPPIAWDDRARAARALANIGPDAKWALPYLAEALHDRVNEVCYNAANAMGHIGRPAVPYLIAALGDTDPNRRRALVNALSQIGPDAEEAVPALTEMLSDTDGPVRQGAAYALQAIGAPWLKRLNRTIAEGESDARISAAKELLLIYPVSMPTMKALLAMAHDPAPAARRQAIEALGIIRPSHSATIPTLTQALGDESPEVRAAAARALGLMGARSKPAIPELTRALDDKDEPVRAAAKEALGRINAGE
jgi:hypothetical protein